MFRNILCFNTDKTRELYSILKHNFCLFLFNNIKVCAEFKVRNVSVRRAGKGNRVQRAAGNAGEG